VSYTSRHRYKSMREKNRTAWRNFKTFFLVAVVALLIYLFMNRVSIKDHLMTYFM